MRHDPGILGQGLAFEHRWAGKSSWSLFVPFWFLVHYPFYPLLSFPCFSPSPHSASFTFSTSLSLSSFSGEQCVFSLRRANVITRASNWWQFSMGALRQHCVGCWWAENVCVCGRSVGLWCLLICFHSKVLQTVCEIQAATRANCSLPQTQQTQPLHTATQSMHLPSEYHVCSQYALCYHNRIHCHVPHLSSQTHSTNSTVQQGWTKNVFISREFCCIFFFGTLKRRAARGEMVYQYFIPLL